MGQNPENTAKAAEDHTFVSAHGTVMIFAWIVFASTAILFARYGRTLRFRSKEKLLGELVWFQVHRFLACLTTVATLLGFFLILVQTKAMWVPSKDGLGFVHSVLGGIIVCCALLQGWMALFRCHPDSSFRFIFNWLHRLTGTLSFFLSIPALFTTAIFMKMNETGMVVILSIWSVWVVAIVVILEIIQFRIGKLVLSKTQSHETELPETNGKSYSNERNANEDEIFIWNKRILILFLIHIIISIALAIPLVVLVWIMV